MPVAATGGGNASYGRITVVKRNGQDSAFFELKYKDYLFGRASHCDVCIQLETIAEEHCRVFQDAEGKVMRRRRWGGGSSESGAEASRAE